MARPALVAYNLADAVAALPRFQREFRRLFGSRMPGNRLDEQDRREQKNFDAVLALCNAYLGQPTLHWREEPERRAMAMMWRAVDQLPQRFLDSLTALESEGIRARILRQPDRWENTPALWIALDSDDPLHVLAAPALARPLLRQGVLGANLDDEQTRWLQRRWEQVVILPSFRGRALEQQAWLAPIYRLISEDSSSEFEWLDQIPRPVNDEDWKTAGLQCWNSPEMEGARQFLTVIARFKVFATHLSGLLALTQSEDADHEVLQGYLDRYQGEWSGIVQSLIDGVGAFSRKFNQLSDEEKQLRPFFFEATVTACDHFQYWLPPGLEGGQSSLSVEACENWLGTVTANIEALDTMGVALLLDSFVQAATASPSEAGSSA